MATTLKGIKPGLEGGVKTSQEGAVVEFSVTYIVISSIVNETIYNVLSTTGLPTTNIPDAYGMTCTNKDAKQDPKAPTVWEVKCDFSSENQKQDTNSNNPDPATWIPTWSSGIETYEEVLYFDKSSTPKPYVNWAKCKFPEPLIGKRSILVYDFFQYHAAGTSDLTIAGWNETTNSAEFKSFPAFSLKCTVKGIERGFFYQQAKVKVSYSVAYKPDGWKRKPLQMGYEYLDSNNKRIVSDYMIALNSDGSKRADNAAPLADEEFLDLTSIAFNTFLRV